MPKRQYITSSGYLSEDGVLDYQAACMAASSFHRTPLLTYRECLLAVFLLMKGNHCPSNREMAKRLNVERHRIDSMVTKIKKCSGDYDSLFRTEGTRTRK